MRLFDLVVATPLLLGLTAALQLFSEWGNGRIQLPDTAIAFRYSRGGKPPLLLVHGFPQHSPTWTTIGPLLAEQYTVIAPDNRGSGDSSLSHSENYTALAGGEDLLAVLNYLNVSKAFVFAQDKGVGLATALAIEHPERVQRLVLAEYPLPGYGYSTEVTSPSLYNNWQLAFFTVPDAAQYFIQGREREMLAWYFWHASYSGNANIKTDALELYTRAISKPGFLRAGMMYFAAAFEDADFFKTKISTSKLQMPLLVMGGEASFAPETALRAAFEPVSDHLSVYVIPKAGHWIGDENPAASAVQVAQFLEPDRGGLIPLDLDALELGQTSMAGVEPPLFVTPGTKVRGSSR